MPHGDTHRGRAPDGVVARPSSGRGTGEPGGFCRGADVHPVAMGGKARRRNVTRLRRRRCRAATGRALEPRVIRPGFRGGGFRGSQVGAVTDPFSKRCRSRGWDSLLRWKMNAMLESYTEVA